MESESTIDTRTVDRTGGLALVRVLDFDKLAKGYPDGSIPVGDLKAAGDFVVVVTPTGRDAKPTRYDVADEAAGVAWLDGFEACADLKKKGARKPNGTASKYARKNKGELVTECKKRKLDMSAAKTKGDLCKLLDDSDAAKAKGAK